jgi:predicted negative regulator of RcsB-dependent stress response
MQEVSMSPEETGKSVKPEAETQSGDPVESMFVSITENWKEVLIGLVVAVIVTGSVMLYQHKARTARENAFTQLAVASTPSQFNEIIRQFPSTKAAEMATLMSARSLYGAGNYNEATLVYTKFINAHPKHIMIPAAKLGVLHCQEAAGQTETALKGYQTFVQDNPAEKAFGTVARLGEARCLRAMGKLQEAISLYDLLLLEQDETDWKPLIEDLKSTTVKDFERTTKQPLATPAPAQAPAAP